MPDAKSVDKDHLAGSLRSTKIYNTLIKLCDLGIANGGPHEPISRSDAIELVEGLDDDLAEMIIGDQLSPEDARSFLEYRREKAKHPDNGGEKSA